ncbi:MAG: L-seryl-tRNA(Sec) selenium transferase [Desulfobulbus sp.]
MHSSRAALLQRIPNVDMCIRMLVASGEVTDIPLARLKYGIRLYLEGVRKKILAGTLTTVPAKDSDTWLREIILFLRCYHKPRLVKVINATGIIVHTNLGRSLLPGDALDAIYQVSASYSNLEFDLASGSRGSRYSHVEEVLTELTGAEAALVVNNNAAGVLLALETLARGREVPVSRGQLVEIGGSFRIPDIMQRSGARLVEVGTTNRTHLDDYEQAITDETAMLLKVHCSNYRIIGFTKEVANRDLVDLAHRYGLVVMEDLGSGCLIDLAPYGLVGEPTVQAVVASGVDLVTFSGDKLLGGPQAGIILGKKELIDKLKKNPLNRALRIDKLTLAALESVLRLYLDPDRAVREIPTLALLTLPEEVVRERAETLCRQCRELLGELCAFEVLPSHAQIGGGALPAQDVASWAVALQNPRRLSISRLEGALRRAALPVIGRLEHQRLLLDMRTVADDELPSLLEGLQRALQGGQSEQIALHKNPC